MATSMHDRGSTLSPQSGPPNIELDEPALSLRGKPAKALSILPRGNHFSAIAAMCSEGVLACKVVEGAVNAETFETFSSIELSSELFPFDGVNPRSIVVMDNAM